MKKLASDQRETNKLGHVRSHKHHIVRVRKPGALDLLQYQTRNQKLFLYLTNIDPMSNYVSMIVEKPLCYERRQFYRSECISREKDNTAIHRY